MMDKQTSWWIQIHPPRQKGLFVLGEKSTSRRNGGPRSNNSEMEGRNKKKGGERKQLCCTWRQGVPLDGWALAIDKVRPVASRPFIFAKCWSDCQEQFRPVLQRTCQCCSASYKSQTFFFLCQDNLISKSFSSHWDKIRVHKVANEKLQMGNLITNNQGFIDCKCRFFLFQVIVKVKLHRKNLKLGGCLYVTQRRILTCIL